MSRIASHGAVVLVALLTVLAGCAKGPAPAVPPYVATDAVDEINKNKVVTHRAPCPALGKIERLDPAFDKLIGKDAKIEIIAEGFVWTEGPVWVKNGGYLLFSDIPPNAIYKWRPGHDAKLWMRPSGYTGSRPRIGEPGTNGLTIGPDGKLYACAHGDHCILRLASLADPNGRKTTLVNSYGGKRLNSPNDLCFKSNGDIYFTDPPYGLEKRMDDPAKQLDFQGVYRLGKDGKLTLLTKEVTRPNGIAFSPDEKTLYVASSDPAKAVWYAFAVKADGTLGAGKVLFDATPWVKDGRPGLPDGMKVDMHGNLFACGPGGVHVFSPAGKHLGTLNTGQRTANCAWGNDGSVLYITADMYLCRIQTMTKGAGW